MSLVRPAPNQQGFEIVALFRYDLDSAGVNADSALVLISTPFDDHERLLNGLEEAATRLADILGKGEPLHRVYALRETVLEPLTDTLKT